MGKVIVFVIGSGLLIVSAVIAMQTREFVGAAHSIEGRVSSGDSGKRNTRRTIEFWVKHSDYHDPFAEVEESARTQIDRAIKESEKITGRPPKIGYTPIEPRPMPESFIRAKTHTRYTFVTYSSLIGIDREKVSVLYDPESLSKGENRKTGETFELDSSRAMVNTFTSVYAYSIVAFIPGSLLFTGGMLAFLKSRFMGLRYFRQWRTAAADARGWVRCPGCKVRFNTKDFNRWDCERHTSCGQRIKITHSAPPAL